MTAPSCRSRAWTPGPRSRTGHGPLRATGRAQRAARGPPTAPQARPARRWRAQRTPAPPSSVCARPGAPPPRPCSSTRPAEGERCTAAAASARRAAQPTVPQRSRSRPRRTHLTTHGWKVPQLGPGACIARSPLSPTSSLPIYPRDFVGQEFVTKKKKRKKENELAPSRQSAGQVACRAGSGGRPPPRRCRRTF